MKEIVLNGWEAGFNKVGLTKLLQSDFKFSLGAAKGVTDSVLGGHEVKIELRDE